MNGFLCFFLMWYMSIVNAKMCCEKKQTVTLTIVATTTLRPDPTRATTFSTTPTTRATTFSTTPTTRATTPTACIASGALRGKQGTCNAANDSECCATGKNYPTFQCSPSSTSDGKYPARLTLNGFAQGEDGGGAAECDGKYHSNSEPIVAVSTGWYDQGSLCGRHIIITLQKTNASTTATVVDECDSTAGCDAEHAYQPPCDNNIVDASAAVWRALGVSTDDDDYGYAQVVWKVSSD